MLTVLLGDLHAGKSDKILEMIKEDLEAGRQALLLVPEQETLTAELRFSSALPPDAPLSFEVSNFSRLADTVFRKQGGVAKRYADASTQALLMWKAVKEVSPFMHTPEKPDRNGISGYLAAVEKLQQAAVLPSQLAAVTEKISDERLRGRCEDLARLSSAFFAILKKDYADLCESADRLVDILQKNTPFLQTKVYIDGFTSFTEQEYRIIGSLMPQCDVALSLCLPTVVEGTTCYVEMQDTQRRILNLAKEKNTSISLLHLKNPPKRPSMLCHGMTLLQGTDYTGAPYGGKPDGSLRLVVADDPFDECDFIAADICRQVRAGGRYRDFTVIAADASRYAGLLDAALDKAGIPYFFTTRTDLDAFEAIKLIHSAYTVLQRGWQAEDLIGYAKCGFCGISAEELDRFEVYTEIWRLEGEHFTDGSPWKFPPEGPDGKPSAEGDRILSGINGTKEALLPPLLQLGRYTQETATVRIHATELYQFLRSVRMEENLKARAKKAAAEGASQEAEQFLRLWEVILDALDKLVDTLGDETLSQETFHELLSVLFSQEDIGSIPSSLDQVTVGSADTLRPGAPKTVYLLGLSEGEFPAALRDDGYFSANDCAVLQKLELPLEASPEKEASRARFVLLRALMSAREEAVLLYPLADSGMRSIRPSPVIRLFRESFGDGCLPPLRTGDLSLLDRIYTPQMAAERLGESEGTPLEVAIASLLRQDPCYGDLPQRIKRPLSNVDCEIQRETVSLLYRQSLHLSQTSMERFAGCPFSYWCMYGLALKEEKRMEFANNIIGSYVHLLLEIFLRLLKKDGKSIHALGEEDTQYYARLSAEESAKAFFPDPERISARTVFLLEKLSSIAELLIRDMVEEFAQSDFTPIFQELKIGEEGGPDSMIFRLSDGIEVSFSGIIDRVDAMAKNGKLYLRVVDYKTGTKEFSPKDIKEGKNIQTLLYLAALWKSRSPEFLARLSFRGEILPAAVEYVVLGGEDPVLEVPMEKEEALALAKGRLNRAGLALGDEAILRAMDKELSGRFLPGKTGKTDFSGCQGHLFSLDTLGELLESASAVVQRIGEAICQGSAHAPSQEERKKMDRDPCLYCKAKPICRNVSNPMTKFKTQ